VNGIRLNQEERAVLVLAAHGFTDDAGAAHAGTSPRTYRRRLRTAQRKLGARNKTHAVAIAATLRIITVGMPARRAPGNRAGLTPAAVPQPTHGRTR
jgi:DNA-binding CsgD family transcriptional regulator